MRIAIIGAGIVGLAVARELSRYEVKIEIFEAREDVGLGTSKANTGIIHAGFDDPPHTNRARFCRRGNQLWRRWADELNIPVSWSGEIVVARSDDELKKIEELKQRGEKNGVRALQIWDKNTLKRREPKINPEISGALFAPTGGVMESFFATIAIYENLLDNGVHFHFNSKVTGVKEREDKIEVVARERGTFDLVINAAGLYGDEIASMMGYRFKIYPRKGEYLIFPKNTIKLNHIIFPAPSETTKGVVVVNTPSGVLMVGPNAQDCKSKEDYGTSEAGLEFVYESAKNLVPTLPPREKSIRQFSGLRAETDLRDFIMTFEDNFWNLIGMRSPGLTAAPAIAEYVAQLAKDRYSLRKKEKWIPWREPYSRGGRIVCDCENVSEMEIREAIRRGARTVEGVKRRTMAMMGTCQGSFCLPEILKIMAEEMKVKMSDIRLKGDGWIVVDGQKP